MRHLIVNADDFGACSGVNRGIADAHRQGIVTSASLMVAMPGSEEAADLAGECPALSVGLHVSFVDEQRQPVADESDLDACRALDAQLARFTELLGRLPTHLDSHHHVHTRPGLLPRFREVAQRCGIPLRECSGARYCSRFYGQWAGESHPEQVSVAGLIRILETEVGEGVTELGCHPGYPDPTLVSSYAEERELELRTLCDARVRRFLETSGIAPVAFGQVSGLAASAV
jgi:chitin disaccharide deacetylase